MADSSDRNKAVQYELAQDDPFAELTRIMGHDPREVVPLQPEAPEPADDLALDLENELMGHLTDEGNPGAAGYDREMASWQQEFAGAQYEPAEASAPEGAPDFESALEALLEETAPESEQPDGYPDYPPAGEPDYPAAGENEAEGFADPAFAPQVEEAAPDNDLPLHEASSEAEFADFEPEAAENPPEAVAFPEPVELPASPDATPDPFEEEQGTYQPGVDVFAAPEDVPLAQENEVTGASHGFSEERQEPEDQEPEGFADEEWAFIDWQEVTPTGQDAFAAQPQQPWSDAQDERARSPSPEEPSTSAAPEPRYGEAWPPEIDTVEVPEDTVAIADNLDIPEVSYRDEVKPAAQFDEIEEILAGAFGETDLSADVWAETASVDEQTGAPAAREDDYVEDYLAAGIPAAAGFGTAAAAYAQGADSPGERWAAPEGAIPPLAPQPGTEPPAGPRRRLPGGPVLMAIGALAVVVLLGGGATLLAFSLGGDDSEPVVIAADDSPIKIRPENPGGIQIPNQDNQVYRRVSGEEVPDARPAQAELIETTEEPVELTPPPGVREANLRLPSEAAPQEEAQVLGEAQSSEAETSQGAKIAERLTPAAGAEESVPEQDITALAPRRVRSMVVRPDGSIVPREMPEPAEASAASESSDAAPPDGQAGEGQQVARTTAGAQNSAEPAESVAAAVPEQGPIPPSRPAGIAAASNQQRAPQADAGSQTPQASQQVAAVANPPAQATAAPSSEWSVQIASQPTVEGAQQSYQQLAQRFGSMLQGRGVNIVQAEIEGRGTYYRVRIPSSSKEDAIELCSQLKSAGGSCFVSQ